MIVHLFYCPIVCNECFKAEVTTTNHQVSGGSGNFFFQRYKTNIKTTSVTLLMARQLADEKACMPVVCCDSWPIQEGVILGRANY